jgi:hypothetical protein
MRSTSLATNHARSAGHQIFGKNPCNSRPASPTDPRTSRCLRPGRVNLELFSGTPPIAAVAAWHGHSAEEMLRTYAHAVEQSLTSAGATMFTDPGEVAG